MNLAELTRFFAWFTLLNYSLMLVSWLAFILLKDPVMRFHSATMGLPKTDLPRLYFQFFSIYKVLILTFGLAPYLVLRFGFAAG